MFFKGPLLNVCLANGVSCFMECTHLFNFACTAVHLHHCTKWACAHLKPPLSVSLLLCAVASQNLSQNFLLASGLPEATTLPIARHLPLITTGYSAQPSPIIQPIPFAVSGMRMCAYMCELGHRALTPEHAILNAFISFSVFFSVCQQCIQPLCS